MWFRHGELCACCRQICVAICPGVAGDLTELSSPDFQHEWRWGFVDGRGLREGKEWL